jgi:predicted Zn-dependent peptidase
MRGLSAFCACALAAFCVLPMRASADTGALPHGGTYILQSDPTVAQSAVELWFRVPSDGYDDATPGIAQVAAAACAAAPLTGARSLAELATSTGGRLSIDVYPDIVAISIVGPASAARRVVAAMTAAYFAPTLTDDALKAGQRDAAVLGVDRRYATGLAMQDALFAQLFAGGPAHVSPIPDDGAQTSKLALAGVTAFVRRAFRAGNAYLVLTGNVGSDVLSAVTDGDGANSPDAPFDSSLAPSPQNLEMLGSADATGFAWIGPGIADEKAATAMDFLSDYLFSEPDGAIAKVLAASASSAIVGGQFITLHDPGVLVVTLQGPGADAARAQVLAGIAAATKPLDAAAFAAARNAFLYHIARDAATPSSSADALGWYASEGNPSYAPAGSNPSYLEIARSLDAQYVAAIARRYLQTPVIVHLETPQSGTST